ncbi:MAG TPA: DUF6089 family protein [Bacteroidales bacterium]|nr:DUF6089 family protein [Bacteroidales bacterium]
MKRIFFILVVMVFVVGTSLAQVMNSPVKETLKTDMVNTSRLFTGQNNSNYKNKSFKKDIHKVYIAVGASNFLGDLGGLNKIGSETFSLRDFDIQAVRPSVMVGYIYRFAEHFAWRSSFDYIWLSGNDKWTLETFRHNRNLNFRTSTYGLSSSIVFLYEIKQKGRKYNLRGVRAWRNLTYTPYIQAGIGGLYFNSKGKYDGSWHSLKPLCTEGQTLVPTRKEYSSFQATVPLGVGLRIKISKEWEIGLEYSQWLTFTDYLDDVSTTYFDENALLQSKGQLAVSMANPAIDDTPGMPLYNSTRPGQQRGDPRDNDHFIGLFFTVYYSINEGYTPKLRF